jgi:hypothetical protein
VIRADDEKPFAEMLVVAVMYFLAGEKPEAVKLLNEIHDRMVLASKDTYYVGAGEYRSSVPNVFVIAALFDLIGERGRAAELYLEAYSSYDDTSPSADKNP